MKKKIGNRLTLKKSVISNLDKVRGGIAHDQGGIPTDYDAPYPGDKLPFSIPHTDCFCWPTSTDTFWSLVGCDS